MGYKAKRTVYKLVFDDPEMKGLVVRAKAATIGEAQEFEKLNGDLEICEGLSRYLVEWNMEDDSDQPVPCTAEGLATLEAPFLTSIIQAWRLAGMRVAAPLEWPSNDGALSEVESIPMEPLSPSLAS